MKNLMKSFRELSYFELLGMNGGYGGGSSGGSGNKSGGSGYSGGSGGSSSSKRNSSGYKTGYERFISSNKKTITTGKRNPDGSETITTTDRKTGKVISSYTYGTAKGSSYSSSSSGTLSSGSSKNGTTSKGYSSGSGGYTVSYGHSSSGNTGTYSGSSSGWENTYKTSYEIPSSGNGTSSISSEQEKNKYSYQTCTDKNNVHCDIIAWNHAVDAGLNPAGNGNDNWDGNKLTVDEIYNKHYADEAVDFNSDLAGKKGYIFYDWEGDGKFDHIEYCEVDVNGTGYSFYNNKGYEKGEEYYYRTFAEDNNAGAKNGGPGKLKFVALN